MKFSSANPEAHKYGLQFIDRRHESFWEMEGTIVVCPVTAGKS